MKIADLTRLTHSDHRGPILQQRDLSLAKIDEGKYFVMQEDSTLTKLCPHCFCIFMHSRNKNQLSIHPRWFVMKIPPASGILKQGVTHHWQTLVLLALYDYIKAMPHVTSTKPGQCPEVLTRWTCVSSWQKPR